MSVKLQRQIASFAEYHRLFIKYEIMVNSKEKVSDAEINELEKLIGQYEEVMNVSPKPIEHSELIQYFLNETGMTQSELAVRLNVSQPLINRILNDDIKISRKLAFKLAEEFNVNKEIFSRNLST